MSRTHDFFAPASAAPSPAPFAKCFHARTTHVKAVQSTRQNDSLETRLLALSQDLARSSSEESLQDEPWSSTSTDSEVEEEEDDAQPPTPKDSPYTPLHHLAYPFMKSALKQKSAGLERTRTSVSFDDSHVAVWETYSPCSYTRRGPDPVKKLSLTELLELQEIQCGIPWQFNSFLKSTNSFREILQDADRQPFSVFESSESSEDSSEAEMG